MISGANAAKWTGKWLLQIPVYLVTSYVMRTLIGGGYRLLIRAGANLPPNLLLRHLLWVALAGGFLAGLLGMVLFRATLLLPLKLTPRSGSAWSRPQTWTWALPTFWLGFGMMAWLGHHAQHTILAESTSGGASGLLAAFFGSGCSIPAVNYGYAFLHDCMNQITFTHPWVGTVGYSAATFVPANWFDQLRGSQAHVDESPKPEKAAEESRV